MLIEVVYDLDEFLSLLSDSSRIHHEVYWKPVEKMHGLILKAEAGIIFYGVSKEGHIVRCELNETVDWRSDELNKHKGDSLHERLGCWIDEQWKRFEERAKEIGSTPGRFETVVLPALHERN